MDVWKPLTSDKQIAKLAVGKKHRVADHLCIRLTRAAPSRGAELVGYWSLRCTIGGVPRECGLDRGIWPTLKLADAKDAATLVMADVLKGADPVTVRRAERAETYQAAQAKRRGHKAKPEGTSLADIATGFYEAHSPKWRRNTEIAWHTRQKHIMPILGALDPLTIEVADVLKVLEKPVGDPPQSYWHRYPKQASFLRMHIESLLATAYSRAEITKANPARWQDHLENLLAGFDDDEDEGRNVPIPLDRFPSFISWLRGIDTIPARCLEWTALTACRSHMAVEATRAQIDLQAGVWSLTKAEMKGDRPFRVPLTPDLLRLLEALPQKGLLFPSLTGKVMGTKFLRDLLHAFCAEASLHGLRSDFGLWCQAMGIEVELREISLSHRLGKRHVRVYIGDGLEPRREIMGRYGQFAAGKLALPPQVLKAA